MTQLWAPLARDHVADPYPMYEQIRSEARFYRAHTEEWIVTHYEDVERVLKDNRFSVGFRLDWIRKGVSYFQNKDVDFSAIAKAFDQFILFIKPPRHAQLRKYLHETWDDRDVEPLINENIDQLLHDVSQKPEVDLIQDFAKRLPSMTISRILGVPHADYQQLMHKGHQLIKAIDLYNSYRDLVRVDEAARYLIDYFLNFISALRAKPGDGLIQKLIDRNDLELTDEELASVCILFLTAGQETSIGLIGTGLYNLGLHSEVREQIVNDSVEMTQVINELLRYDSPAQFLGRKAEEDVQMGDTLIRQGDLLTIGLGAANRDPNQFDRPSNLDITRKPNRHLAFGVGAHYCLGDWLGKKQGALAIRRFLDTFPGYEVVPGSQVWDRHITVRKLEHLNVRIKP